MPQSDFEQRKDKRIEREYARYLKTGGKPLKPWEVMALKEQGYVDDNGLTAKGELELHQLRLLKWMTDHGEVVDGKWRRNK